MTAAGDSRGTTVFKIGPLNNKDRYPCLTVSNTLIHGHNYKVLNPDCVKPDWAQAGTMSLCSPVWSGRPGDKHCQMLLRLSSQQQTRSWRKGRKKKKGTFHPHSLSLLGALPSFFSFFFKHPPSRHWVVGKCVFDRKKKVCTLRSLPLACCQRGCGRSWSVW